MTAQRELIINGPIACGKSTVAQALAAQRRRSGSSAAVLDLDHHVRHAPRRSAHERSAHCAARAACAGGTCRSLHSRWHPTADRRGGLLSSGQRDGSRARGYFLRIETRASATFVGTVSLRLSAYDHEPWTTEAKLGILGYAVLKEEHGRGFATEAAASMVQFAFGDLDLHCLPATALRDNIASRRVLERLGFRIRYIDVGEVSRHGGPPRLGDTYMLERGDSQAVQRTPQAPTGPL